MNEEPEQPINVRPLTWPNRIIHDLYALCVVGTLLGIPGVIIAKFLLPAEAVRLAARWVFVAAVLSDLLSVYLDVSYLLRVGDLHGQAFFALAYYVVFVIFGMDAAWWWRLIAMAALFMFHVGCQWQVAQPIARMLGWRPQRSSRDGQGERTPWVDVHLTLLNHFSLVLAGLGIPGLPIAALFLPAETVRLAARCVLGAAVLSDVTSVYSDVTHLLWAGPPAVLRAERKKALFAAGYYAVFVVVGMSAAWWWRLIAVAALFIFHFGCQDYLPRPIARRLGWRPKPYSRSGDGSGE